MLTFSKQDLLAGIIMILSKNFITILNKIVYTCVFLNLFFLFDTFTFNCVKMEMFQ
jgi:hypothetical protein